MLDIVFGILLIGSVYYIIEGVADFIYGKYIHIIYPLWKNKNN